MRIALDELARRLTGHRRRGVRRHPAAHRRTPCIASSPSTTRRSAAATVLTAHVADPTGYGRVVRGDGRRSLRRIVEHRDADDGNAGARRDQLRHLRVRRSGAARPPSTGSPPTTARARSTSPTSSASCVERRGQGVRASRSTDPDEVMGVNDRVQLAEARSLMRDRINDGWMRAGVSIIDPATTLDRRRRPSRRRRRRAPVDPAATEPPRSPPAPRSAPARSWSTRPSVADATVRFTTADRAVIGAGRQRRAVHLPASGHRARTSGARAGAFVETKNATVGEGSKIPHLSYVGDAEIGVGSNIGAATVVRELRRGRQAPHRRSVTTSASAATRCSWRR